jgi:hypothetical protein
MNAKADSFSVSEFLPADITMLNGAFRVSPPATAATVRLSDLCGGACPPVAVPKPAFTTQLTTGISIAGDVVRATTGAGSSLRARVTQDFGFDLLAPAGATSAGSLVLRVLSRTATTAAWDTLATSALSGAAATFPSGATLSMPLALPAGRTIGREIRLEVAVFSPAGDPVMLDGSRSLVVTLDAPTGIAVASATINFAARTIDNEGGTLDLTELDFEADKLRSATLTLDIDNPLDIVGDATLLVQHNGATLLTKSFPLAVAHSAPVVAFTSAELQAMRGGEHTLVLRANVRASKTNGEVTVRPTDVIRVKSAFQATIRPTGSPSISQ